MTKLDYKIGDTVKHVGRTSYEYIPLGELVTVVDIGGGMFAGDIYVTVERANGKRVTGYDWRFASLEGSQDS